MTRGDKQAGCENAEGRLASRAMSTRAEIQKPAPLAEMAAPALAREAGRPLVSLVIPGLNEAESLPELSSMVHAALKDRSYELIFIDDGSKDDSWKVICRLHEEDSRVRGLRMRANFGKAAALSAGFERARGDIVIMMDADLQDDPSDLPSFFSKLDEGFDVIVGWKKKRLDPLNRRILSKIFNGTVGFATGVRLHDMNCGFKAFRREVVEAIPVYGDLFRFIPVLAHWKGFRVAEVVVTHRERRYGSSRYGLERILRGMFDLLSVVFITRYLRRPMHLFGVLGMLSALMGFGICAYLSVLWFQGHQIGTRPLLLLGVLLIVIGIQFFSLGLLGEFLTFPYHHRVEHDKAPIRDKIGEP